MRHIVARVALNFFIYKRLNWLLDESILDIVASNIVEAVGDQETTNMLVNLGASTAILLGGATAFNMLQHHLTVNVFWV